MRAAPVSSVGVSAQKPANSAGRTTRIITNNAVIYAKKVKKNPKALVCLYLTHVRDNNWLVHVRVCAAWKSLTSLRPGGGGAETQSRPGTTHSDTAKRREGKEKYEARRVFFSRHRLCCLDTRLCVRVSASRPRVVNTRRSWNRPNCGICCRVCRRFDAIIHRLWRGLLPCAFSALSTCLVYCISSTRDQRHKPMLSNDCLQYLSENVSLEKFAKNPCDN